MRFHLEIERIPFQVPRVPSRCRYPIRRGFHLEIERIPFQGFASIPRNRLYGVFPSRNRENSISSRRPDGVCNDGQSVSISKSREFHFKVTQGVAFQVRYSTFPSRNRENSISSNSYDFLSISANNKFPSRNRENSISSHAPLRHDIEKDLRFHLEIERIPFQVGIHRSRRHHRHPRFHLEIERIPFQGHPPATLTVHISIIGTSVSEVFFAHHNCLKYANESRKARGINVPIFL